MNRFSRNSTMLACCVVLGIGCESSTDPPMQKPKPTVSLGAAFASSNSIALNGTVNPEGSETTARFDYGTQRSLGLQSADQSLDDGEVGVPVSATLDALVPLTWYYYRLTATNAGGTVSTALDSVRTLTPNSPPDTQVTAAPPDSSTSPAFFWTGSDTDGEVRGYAWRVSDNGADGMVDVGDTMGLPWTSTTFTDQRINVSANLPGLPGDAALPERDQRSWQTHTFFVRAQDDRGEFDPTPAQFSFVAVTNTPIAVIDPPGKRRGGPGCASLARNALVGWTVDDADAEDDPAFVRVLLVPLADLGQPACFASQTEFEAVDLLAPSLEDRWSEWQEHPSPASQLGQLDLPPAAEGELYLFAVQARDVPGAVTTWFGLDVNAIQVLITAP